METKIMTITPEAARYILESSNTDNRKIRESWVTTLAEAIRRGEWKTTHQGIAFDTNGVLQDGQHRLSAICAANIPVQMMVTTGLPPINFCAIDQHAKRTLADATKRPKTHVEIARVVAQIVFRKTVPTVGQIIEILDDRLSDRIDILLNEYSSAAVKLFSSAPIRALAASMSLADGHDMDYIFSSYRRLVLRDYLSMSPLEASICRIVDKGGLRRVSGIDPGQFAHMFYLFDKRNKDKMRFTLGDVEKKYNDSIATIRSVWPDKGDKNG